MRVTIEFDDVLNGRLKDEAARRRGTVSELVGVGVRHVLDSTEAQRSRRHEQDQAGGDWRPNWFRSLAKYGRAVEDHTMEPVRGRIVRARKRMRRY